MSSIILRSDVDELDVSAMVLRLPIRGNWVALLTIGASIKPTVGAAATVVVTQENGTEDLFVGTVRASENVDGTDNLSVTVVGGKGKLVDPPIAARHHTGGTSTIPAGLVLFGIAAAAGEALAAGVENAIDAYPLVRWTRAAGPAGLAVDLLAWALELAWRVLPDGTVWMGAETWPEIDNATAARGFFERAVPSDNTLIYSTDGCPFRPGTTINGARAVEVCYHVDANEGDAARWLCEVRHAGPGDAVYSPDLTLYRASYAGTVRAQNSSTGTLAIECDDARISDQKSGLLDIPAETSWPGCFVTIPQGTRCRILFASADPRNAYAAPSIDMDSSASVRFALLDDQSDCGTLSGTVTVTPASVGGPPIPVTFVYAGPFGGGTGASAALNGKIIGPGHKYAKGVPNA